ncbi:MAG: F0F1 ATP synthase subunit delta [Puniceicoccales bacterium]|jgi:F-type H+-transporting ATPase subunit delta|nr:F0F1 ATP synthase subunit delta [Puniceicoccales bacterium]
MSANSTVLHAEARRLVAISLENGVVSTERVRAALDVLVKTRKPAKLRPLLKAYYIAIRREIARSEARIEYAGKISEEAPALLASHFTKVYGRPIAPVPSENPALIAGVRVRVGDDVYDASARGTLERLASHLS